MSLYASGPSKCVCCSYVKAIKSQCFAMNSCPLKSLMLGWKAGLWFLLRHCVCASVCAWVQLCRECLTKERFKFAHFLMHASECVCVRACVCVCVCVNVCVEREREREWREREERERRAGFKDIFIMIRTNCRITNRPARADKWKSVTHKRLAQRVCPSKKPQHSSIPSLPYLSPLSFICTRVQSVFLPTSLPTIPSCPVSVPRNLSAGQRDLSSANRH
jgi:hypothetical protein